MEILSSIWDIISALIVVSGGIFIAHRLSRHFDLRPKRAIAIYLWHTLLCLAYLWYASVNGADSIDFYERGKSGNIEFGAGTSGIIFLTAIIVRPLELPILGTFLVYNVFGVVGLMAFDGCLRKAVQYKSLYLRRLATLIVFLPSVSFWSSAIGKDSLSFMATGLALWASMALDRRWVLMTFAVAVMIFVRPHMGAMMLLAWTFAVLVNSHTHLFKRTIIGGLALVAAVVIIPFAIQYAGLAEGDGPAELMAYLDKRQSYNLDAGSSVDIASMSLPMQLTTYMFRPFILEANSIFLFAAAFDNLILLYLFMLGLWGILHGRKSKSVESRVFIWTYIILAWPILAMSTANLGIALRQKWMFAPMLIFLMISFIDLRKCKRRAVVRSLPVADSDDLISSSGRPT